MAHWQIKKGGQTAADQLEHMDVNKVLAQVHRELACAADSCAALHWAPCRELAALCNIQQLCVLYHNSPTSCSARLNVVQCQCLFSRALAVL